MRLLLVSCVMKRYRAPGDVGKEAPSKRQKGMGKAEKIDVPEQEMSIDRLARLSGDKFDIINVIWAACPQQNGGRSGHEHQKAKVFTFGSASVNWTYCTYFFLFR
jgi:hypothetical protein